MNKNISVIITAALLVLAVGFANAGQASNVKQKQAERLNALKANPQAQEKKAAAAAPTKAVVATKVPENTSMPVAAQQAVGKIVKDGVKNQVKFLDEKGKVVKAIQLGAMPNNKDGYYYENTISGLVSENGQYAGVNSLYLSSSTFSYFNSKGDVLWQTQNLSIILQEAFKISADGYRVLLVTETIKDIYADTKTYFPCIYDNKGNLLWALGEYSEVRDIFITKNGKYGCFVFEKYKVGGSDIGTVFFDIGNKKEILNNEFAYALISENGKASNSTILGNIEVYPDGHIEFYGEDGVLVLEKPFKDITKEELKLFTKEEISKIKELLGNKNKDDIFRKKIIYEYQF